MRCNNTQEHTGSDIAASDPACLSFSTQQKQQFLIDSSQICLLHIELDEIIPEEDRSLCGVAYDTTISRDILVDCGMPLHNLHYVIMQAFGLQRSAVHEYELNMNDLKWVTDGKISNWKKLIGLVFRNPIRERKLDYWDDDYTGGDYLEWIRTKYTGPDYALCYEEGYRYIVQAIRDLKCISRKLTYLPGEFVCNPFSVNEVLPVVSILDLHHVPPYDVEKFYEDIRMTIKQTSMYPDDSMASQPLFFGFAHDLTYSYDSDAWRFTITHRNDAGYLIKDNRITQTLFKKAVKQVCVTGRPVIVASDGYPLTENCDGIFGYTSFIRNYDLKEKGCRQYARMMGWRKKVSTDVL